MKQIAYEFHNYETGHCYVDYIRRPDLEQEGEYTQIPLYSKEAEERKTADISRIRKFIQKQRGIGIEEGKHIFGDKLKKQYGKRADEFYDQFADSVYYRDKYGNECRLDIMTLWWFRWNEYVSTNNKAEERKTARQYLEDKYPQMRGHLWNTNPHINDNWVAEMMEEYANHLASQSLPEISEEDYLREELIKFAKAPLMTNSLIYGNIEEYINDYLKTGKR